MKFHLASFISWNWQFLDQINVILIRIIKTVNVKAIKKPIDMSNTWNCFLIVSSIESFLLPVLHDKMKQTKRKMKKKKSVCNLVCIVVLGLKISCFKSLQ